jgi:hypothetical protein
MCAALGVAVFVLFTWAVARAKLFATYDRCLEVFRHKATKPVAPTAHTVATSSPCSWTDFYASHDPVPMGALDRTARARTPGLLGYAATSHRIYNELSWLSDHVTYAENKYEFCAPIVDKLLMWSGVPAAQLPARSAQVLEAHRGLSRIRGMFEHLAIYAFIALLPFLPSTTGWKKLDLVKELSAYLNETCVTWLPKSISDSLCLSNAALATVSQNAISVAWAIVSVALYAFALSTLSILQKWWRMEIANRAIQGEVLSDALHHWVVGLVGVIYAIPFLGIACFYLGPWSQAVWIALLACASSLGLLGIGAELARRSSLQRKVEMDIALQALSERAM